LLGCGCRDAVKAALVCLSLTGTMRENAIVAWKLSDRDAAVAAFAEDALWSIWVRAAGPEAALGVRHAMDLLVQGAHEQAVRALDGLILRYPGFAEAYHQRASARFLAGEFIQAMSDAARALRLNPFHFSAMTYVGHCHAARGFPSRAAAMYRAALRVHPRHEQVRQALEYVSRHLGRPVRVRQGGLTLGPNA